MNASIQLNLTSNPSVLLNFALQMGDLLFKADTPPRGRF